MGWPDDDQPFRARLVEIWGRLADDAYPDGGGAPGRPRRARRERCAHTVARESPTARWRTCASGPEVFGLHLAALDVRIHARVPTTRTTGCIASLAAAAAPSGATAGGRSGRLIVSMTASADDVLAAEARGRGRAPSSQVVPLLETIDDLRGAPAPRRRRCSSASPRARSR